MNARRAKQLRAAFRNPDGSLDRKTYRTAKAAIRKMDISAGYRDAKPLPERNRKPKAPIKATWPATENQKAQSRPVIVAKPLKVIRESMLSQALPDVHGVRSLTLAQKLWLRKAATLPKHRLDALSTRI